MRFTFTILLWLVFVIRLNCQTALSPEAIKSLQESVAHLEETNPKKAIEILTRGIQATVNNELIQLKWQEQRVMLAIMGSLQTEANHYLLEYEKAISFYKKLETETDYLNFLMWKGFYFYLIGDLNSSKKNYLQIIKLTNSTPTKNNYKNLIIAYCSLSDLETKLGNFSKSTEYWLQYIDIQNKFLNKNKVSPFIDAFCANLFLQKGDDKNAQLYIEKALNNLEQQTKKNEDTQNTISIYTFASKIYASVNKHKISKRYIEKAIKLIPQTDYFNLSDTHFKFAQYYTQGSEYDIDKCHFYLNKSLSEKKKYLTTERHYELANIYLFLAKIAFRKNNYQTALNQSQSALIALSKQFNSTDWHDNPPVSSVFSKKDLLETLNFKAELLLAMSKTNPQYLEGAYKTAQLAAGLIDIIRADYTSDFDKQYLADWSYSVYEKAIETAFQLYQKTNNPIYKHTAFGALERSKAVVLLEALRTGQAESALSNEDRNQLYQYKSILQKLETQIYDETTKNKKTPDDSSVQVLHQQLFEHRRQYETLIHRFETQYPNYYRIKFGQNAARLTDIQALLPTDSSKVVLEYFVGDSAVYTFLISKNDCQISKQPKPKDFDARIKTMRQSLPQKDNLHKITFVQQANWLFDMLLKDPLSKQTAKLKKLVIIPDGILNYVPFDMLFEGTDKSFLAQKGDILYNKLPFLIKKYTISYAYSGNLWLSQNQNKNHHAPKVFAGFTAHYQTRDGNSFVPASALNRDKAFELKYAAKEVIDIQRLLGGSVFEKEGEHLFKENAHLYQILHFSMHAIPDDINPQSSKLLFTYNPLDSLEDNDLLASEIYALRLNADLAVLSACQTGYGKINRGEGVMSLSRAFTYAGVGSTVMSLWQVDDRATREIMIAFYENLKQGQDKDDALRNAKLTFLYNNKQNDLHNPDYWAGFIVAGNTSAIDTANGHILQTCFVAFVALFVAFALYLWWKRRNTNFSS